jgi:hypothetical protein
VDFCPQLPPVINWTSFVQFCSKLNSNQAAYSFIHSTSHELNSVKHGRFMSECNQTLTSQDGGDRNVCVLAQHGASGAEIRMNTECKVGVASACCDLSDAASEVQVLQGGGDM